MRIFFKVRAVILPFLCVIFFPIAVFAQNVDAEKSDIYSKLKCCACKVSFDKCDCSQAKEIKAYIDALLESGANREEIFYKSAKKFSSGVILDKQVRQDIEKKLIEEAGDSRPQIVLDLDSFDLGKISRKKGKISKIFRVANKGNAPLIIKQIRTFCPCAAASLKIDKNKSRFFSTEGSPAGWQSEIKPGSTGELEIMVDLSSPHVNTGKLFRDAAITSNDPVHPEVTARIEAEVTE